MLSERWVKQKFQEYVEMMLFFWDAVEDVISGLQAPHFHHVTDDSELKGKKIQKQR